MARPRTVSDPQRARQTLTFLSDSLKDYLAARVLLLAELPQQGAVLASTAIEKACKAALAFHGNECRGHLKRAHWNALRNFDPNFAARFDTGFLALAKKAYELRYTDDLKPGFTLVVASREFLYSLDDFLMHFHNSFSTSHGERADSGISHLVSRNDPRLTSENGVLQKVSETEFVGASVQAVYEWMVLPSGALLESSYSSKKPAKRPGFMREGLVPLDGTPSRYDLSHIPLPQAEA